MEIGKNIRRFREQSDMTQAEVAKRLGVSPTAVSWWESGRTEPKIGTVEKLAELFGVEKSDILGLPKKPTTDHSQWVPVLGRVAAGIPLDMIEDILDYEEIPDHMGECFALRIQGDSMSPDIPNGSTVIVRKQDDVESGEIAIVTINGEDATCKRVIKHELGITLASLNPSFEPMVFGNRDIEEMPIRILGRVMEVRRRF